MRIAYSIYSGYNNIGGHFYTTKTILKNINNHEVFLIVIGNKEIDFFKDLNSKITINYITFTKKNLYGFFKSFYKFNNIIKSNKIDIIHTFDQTSYLWARFYNLFNSNVKIILTKCGGENKYLYPKCTNTVLFSYENFIYYTSKRKFKKINYYIIPNRIEKVEQDYDRIQCLQQKYKIEKFDFLLISRISTHHYKKIISSIEFVKKINLVLNKNFKLLIIGNIENELLYKEISLMTNNDIYIETEPKFTLNASQLIDVSNITIATGRGVIETIMLKKIVLVFVKDKEYPIIVTPQNILTFFLYNFSYRTKTDSNFTLDLLNNLDILSEIKETNYAICKYNFDVREGLNKYYYLYENDLKTKIYFLDLILHTIITIKKILF